MRAFRGKRGRSRVPHVLERERRKPCFFALLIHARQRLAQFGAMLGAAIGLRGDDIAVLERGGYLHDVGKIGIPDSIVNKPSPLTAAEYEIMKQHTIIGERLCGSLRILAPVRPIIRHHHERLHGSGYPDGLRGDAIPLAAQVIAIVDVFDAVTTARPYRLARDLAPAREEPTMDARAGRFDIVLVSAFFELIDAGHIRVGATVASRTR